MLRGERNSPYVFRIRTKQGETRWVMETVTPFFFNGRPALLGNSMNITDRMEAEERLRESEDRYRRSSRRRARRRSSSRRTRRSPW